MSCHKRGPRGIIADTSLRSVFLTAWAPCLDAGQTGVDFLVPTDVNPLSKSLKGTRGAAHVRFQSLRDTLELIDLILETVERFPSVRSPTPSPVPSYS